MRIGRRRDRAHIRGAVYIWEENALVHARAMRAGHSGNERYACTCVERSQYIESVVYAIGPVGVDDCELWLSQSRSEIWWQEHLQPVLLLEANILRV